MKFQGAVIKEQGVTFAVVVVKMDVINFQSKREEYISSFGEIFPGCPIILMAQDSSGRSKYFGRSDIVKFLSHLHISQIPWKEYSVA